MKTNVRGSASHFMWCVLAITSAACDRFGAHHDPGSPDPEPGADAGTDPGVDLSEFGLDVFQGPILTGQVVAGAESQPVANATVQVVGGATAMTDEAGWFTLESAGGSGPAVLIVEHAGFAEAIKRVSLESDGLTSVIVKLAPERGSARFDATEGGQVTDGHGARVVFPPRSLATRDGRVVTGQVDVALAPVDVSDESQRSAFPGDFMGTRLDGKVRPLNGLAPMAISARQGGESLTIASGKTATVSLPISASSAASAPDSVQLLTLDHSSGLWREETTALRYADSAAPGGYVYRTTISHLSWFNGTRWMPSHCISGHVIGLDNRAAGQAAITVFDLSHNATFTTTTDDLGRFALDPPAGAVLRVTAASRARDGVSDPLTFTNDIHEDEIITHIDPYTCSSVGTLYLHPAPGSGPGAPPFVLLPALPSSAWVKDGGGINQLCAPPNPFEAAFATTGSTAILASRSTYANCCTCTRRSRSYPVPRMATATAHLRGRFYSASSPSRYSQPSMRIELLLNGSTVGKRVYASQNRPNNNCVGPSEMPEAIIRSNSSFDIRLSTIAPGQQFDQIRIHLLGYGCEVATNGLAVQQLMLLPR